MSYHAYYYGVELKFSNRDSKDVRADLQKLQECEEVGRIRAAKLLKRFRSLENLKSYSKDELMEEKGVGRVLASSLIDNLERGAINDE